MLNNPPQIFSIHAPEHSLPVVFDSPHSGDIYPECFVYSCHFSLLEKIQDKYIDDLFLVAPDHDAVLLCALFPRSYIDANRARDDIDIHLLGELWPDEKYGPIAPTSRSDAGIGLIPRLIKPGIPIYQHHLGAEEVMNRIMTFYDPYHDALKSLLDEAYYAYGQFWHINCHSMPASTAYPKKNITIMDGQSVPSDIVLGDRDGETCSRDFIYGLRDFWQNLGYRVTINDPFKGVELIRRYSQPTRGKNSIQLEINRSLFMNEDTGEKSKNYAIFKSHIEQMIKFTTAFAQSKLVSMAAD